MADPMGRGKTNFLIAYLLFGTVLTGYVFYSLCAAKPNVDPGAPPPAQCTGASPKLSGLYPLHVNAGAAAEVLLLGCQFNTGSTKIMVNGAVRGPLSVDSSHIRVGLGSADLAAPGTVVVTLLNGNTEFGSGVFIVGPPAVSFGARNISQEAQLLLMVLFIGAFGSCVYALKSLADYQGDAKLYRSWFTFYLIQPFEGAGIAVLTYLVIRAGFLTGIGADVRAVNLFGMCAIAGLAGTFSDTAFLKLREVFQTLFKPQDDRSGKVASLSIATTMLPDAIAGTQYQQTVQARNGVSPLQWSVTPPLPASLALNPVSGTISGTPMAAAPMTKYTFTVTDKATPSVSASSGLLLTIKPLSGGAAVVLGDTEELDGCGIPVVRATLDEDLPASEGGVANTAYSLTWLPRVLKDAGLKVALVDGWDTRGQGDVGETLGVLCHHTAGPRNGNMPTLNTLIQGRPDLSGPLSQVGLGRDGTYYVVAAGRCNHAGPGFWKGVTSGNTNFIGIEAENTGLPNDFPWPPVQLDAYRRGIAAILTHTGRTIDFCVGHKEYALPKGRKDDPDFDMIALRSTVSAILDGTAPPPTLIPPVEPSGGGAGRPTLRRPATGEAVKQVQVKLGLVADGNFGPKTEAALRAFQAAHDLVPDGIVGPNTWAALDAVA